MATVIEKFAAVNRQPDSAYNPLSPANLGDPKYRESQDATYLAAEAQRIYQTRMINIIQRIHDDNRKIAVARDFCFKHKWISSEQYQALHAAIKPPKAKPALSSDPAAQRDAALQHFTAPTDGDDPMSDNPPAPTDPLASDNSSSQLSPADGNSAPMV